MVAPLTKLEEENNKQNTIFFENPGEWFNGHILLRGFWKSYYFFNFQTLFELWQVTQSQAAVLLCTVCALAENVSCVALAEFVPNADTNPCANWKMI